MRNSSRHSTTGSSSRSWCFRRHASTALAKSSAKLSFGSDIGGLSGMFTGQKQARDRLDFRVELALPRQEPLTIQEIKAFVLGGGCDSEIFAIQPFDEPLLHSGHRDLPCPEFLQKAHANRTAIVESERFTVDLIADDDVTGFVIQLLND